MILTLYKAQKPLDVDSLQNKRHPPKQGDNATKAKGATRKTL